MHPLPLTRQHRGLRSYQWTWQHAMRLALLLCLFWLLLWCSMPHIVRGWAQLLGWAWPRLGLGPPDAVQLKTVVSLGIPVEVVRTRFFTPAPNLLQWWLGAGVSVALLAASWQLSRERLPLIYGLRIVGFLGLFSLLAYEYLSAQAVSDANRLLADNMLDIGLAMLWLLPAVHAFVLYIFPMPMLTKALATLSGLAFIAVSIPLQAASLAWLASECSVVVAVPLYMLCTFLPQVVSQLGIYGFFMSLAPAPRGSTSVM
ncbi:MAG: hypothetical protein ACN6O3_00645 [Comamonas sp.]